MKWQVVYLTVNPKGAIRNGEEVKVELRISNKVGFVDNVLMLFNVQNSTIYKKVSLHYTKTVDEYSFFEATYSLERIGLHYYNFSLTINGKNKFIRRNPTTKEPCITENNMEYWEQTVYHNSFNTPDWSKGVMYHIFVDRFRRDKSVVLPEMKNRTIHSNWYEMPDWKLNEKGEITNTDFFAGNLRGITNSLKYIKKLGVSILYLSPVMQSQSNHRYDTADYEKVDPYLGSNEDLKRLCDKAHSLGMKVILDAVFNHTGNDSKYFNQFHNFDTAGAFESQQSPYYNWYRRNGNSFEYWWNFKNLPVCNGDNPDYQNYIYGEGGIIDQWFQLGIDGVRLDVADELTENFIFNIRKAIKRNNPEGFVLGEVWENAITKEKYGIQRTYLLGEELDTVMDYPLTDAILKYVRFGDYQYFKETVEKILQLYPKPAINSMTNSLSTHDITRAITTLVGDGIYHNRYQWTWDIGGLSRQWQFEHDELSKEKYKVGKLMFKLATIMQYTMPGIPCIFYGDEVGVCGYKDPFNRKPYPHAKRDKELLKFFRRIGKVRNKLEFLKEAEYELLQQNENFIIYKRYNKEQEIVVIVKRTDGLFVIPKEYSEYNPIFSLNYQNYIIKGKGAVILHKP